MNAAELEVPTVDYNHTIAVPPQAIDEFKVYKEKGSSGYKLQIFVDDQEEERITNEHGKPLSEFKRQRIVLGKHNSSTVRRRIIEKVKKDGEEYHPSSSRYYSEKRAKAEDIEIEYNGCIISFGEVEN